MCRQKLLFCFVELLHCVIVLWASGRCCVRLRLLFVVVAATTVLVVIVVCGGGSRGGE
jgi:hypothetical protein